MTSNGQRSAGERERLRHSLARLRVNVSSIEQSLNLGGPMGQDAQVLVQSAVEVASQLWRLDAFELSDQDATPTGGTGHFNLLKRPP